MKQIAAKMYFILIYFQNLSVYIQKNLQRGVDIAKSRSQIPTYNLYGYCVPQIFILNFATLPFLQESAKYLHILKICTHIIQQFFTAGLFESLAPNLKRSCTMLFKGPNHLPNYLMADLCQDMHIVSSFRRCSALP